MDMISESIQRSLRAGWKTAFEDAADGCSSTPGLIISHQLLDPTDDIVARDRRGPIARGSDHQPHLQMPRH